MPQGNQINYNYSAPAAVAHNATSSDGPNSLGGYAASSILRRGLVSVDSYPADLRTIEDTTQVFGNAQAGDMIYIMEEAPADARFVTTVLGFDGDFMILKDKLPSAPTTAARVKVFRVNDLFQEVSASEAEDGLVDYRCIFLTNFQAVQLTNKRMFVEVVGAGNDEVKIGIASSVINGSVNVTPITDRFTAPDLSEIDGSLFVDNAYPGGLQEVPGGSPKTMGGSTFHPVWIRRTIAAGTARRDPVQVHLHVEWDNTTGDPNPFGYVIPFSFTIAGPTPVVDFRPDRQIKQAGGVRLTATVTSLESGDPIVGQDVNFEQTVGPGTLTQGPIGNPNRITNERGQAFAPYQAPDGNVGDTVTFEAEVKT